MKYLWVVALMYFSIFAQTAGAQGLAVVTAVWPPYVYEEDQKIAGMATEIVRAVLDNSGIKAEISVYPWKRATTMAKDQLNTMIYPIFRNEERDPHFIWAVPMFNARVSLHKLKKRKDLVINSSRMQNHTGSASFGKQPCIRCCGAKVLRMTNNLRQ